jgi:hypothetical protein
MEHKNFLKLYLLIISLVATLGSVISLGFLVYETLEYQLISDEEYAKQRRSYTQCSSDPYYNDPQDSSAAIQTPHSAESIEACEAKAIVMSGEERTYTYKGDLIASLTWLCIFLLLFGTHFPFFIKYHREKG